LREYELPDRPGNLCTGQKNQRYGELNFPLGHAAAPVPPHPGDRAAAPTRDSAHPCPRPWPFGRRERCCSEGLYSLSSGRTPAPLNEVGNACVRVKRLTKGWYSRINTPSLRSSSDRVDRAHFSKVSRSVGGHAGPERDKSCIRAGGLVTLRRSRDHLPPPRPVDTPEVRKSAGTLIQSTCACVPRAKTPSSVITLLFSRPDNRGNKQPGSK